MSLRGAVLRGTYGNAITSRKARRHYGVMAYRTFDPKRHPVTCKVWDSMEEKWRAENRMSWFVSKGMELLDGKKISLQFYRVVDIHFGSFVFRDELLCCNDESSPEDGEHPSIFPLCTVEADLTKVPKDLFVIGMNSKGEQHYKIPYELEMTFKSASIFFELVFEGISYGSVRAKY
ncbi:hypothetical protein VE00_07873 [Pseudogymnoascus sp. WSF 3629]|nr:hypothetical protein VE00_07873 [Pseudogymnoascus sp. WSF 3629]